MKSIDRYLVYFERSVLSRYRASSDLYVLDEDDMGGTLEAIHGENELPQEHPYFRVRFAFRKLSNRFICIAAWGPDINHLPDREKNVWVGYLLENSIFHDDDLLLLGGSIGMLTGLGPLRADQNLGSAQA